jgi:hypothetical protein
MWCRLAVVMATGFRRVRAALRTWPRPNIGVDPPKIDVALNDTAHSTAHTLERHGPDVPLRQQTGVQTIEAVWAATATRAGRTVASHSRARSG